jgi:hypothetical protein
MFGSDIASNDSRAQYRSQWRINYPLYSWRDRWQRRVGYPVEIYPTTHSMFSPTYVCALVALLSQVLRMIGVEIGSEDLTATLMTVLTVVSAIVILVRRYWKGDLTVNGAHR